MAQSGYTPLLIYGSTTTGNTPSAANLTTSASGVELAINAYDGKLFYKDAAGVVQVLAGKGGTGVVAGSNTQIQFNNNGVFGAAAGLTWDGTYLTANSIKDSALTSGRVTYAGASGLLQDSTNLTFDGTTLTVNGLTVSGTATFSGGTANGVAYLNGSKVLTSGSALTFDGTNLTLNTGYMSFGNNGYIRADSANNKLTFQAGTSGYLWKDSSNSGDWMALTSTGLGIGTSSPSYRLDVKSSAAQSARFWNGTQAIYVYHDSQGSTLTTGAIETGTGVYFNDTSAYIAFLSASSEKMRLDSSGNLGLGVTPSAWGAVWKALQFGGNPVLAGNNLVMANNAYNNGTNWLYSTTNYASRYESNYNGGGIHAWFTAPSGTAGSAISFTQAMTLDAGGNLMVGGTTQVEKLTVTGSIVTNGTQNYIYNNGGSGSSVNSGFFLDGSGSTLRMFTGNTERARIDSIGNLLINSTAISNSPARGVQLWSGSSNSIGGIAIGHDTGVASGNYFAVFNYASGIIGSITQSGTTAVLYNTTSDYRLKTLVAQITDSGARIDALNPVEYDWKADGKRARGFFAHEFQEVYAGSVTGEKDAVDAEGKPVYQAMQAGSSEVIADLVAELKSLRARVAQLESK